MADEGLLMERLKDQLCWVSRVSYAVVMFHCAVGSVECCFGLAGEALLTMCIDFNHH
jgi:hypothetical protein